MAQRQRPADVHQDELCPPKKRYALMDANKKIDLDNLLYPNESKIMANIIQNHLLRFSIAASTSVPWIYLGQFWHTLQEEDGSKALDKYHNLEDDAMVKNIFSSRKHKECVGMKIPSWMITDEMKLTNHYRIDSRKSTVIRLCLPPRLSEQLTPPTPIPTTDEANDLVLQDTLQVSLEELEAKQNLEIVKEHLMAEEIEKLAEGMKNVENVDVVSSTIRQNDNPVDLDIRLKPKSDKESPELELTIVEQPVNVNEEEKESAEDDYELKQREKGKHVEE
ncbi:hypothetical protein Tco_1039054 [Tanacetum coccineum]